MGRQQQERLITRRELATSVGVHPDSLSRVLADGLASAVLVWGGRGQEQRFSPRWPIGSSAPGVVDNIGSAHNARASSRTARPSPST